MKSKEIKETKEQIEKPQIAFNPILNTCVTHSHSQYITKLITGFGCTMEHDVGEKPNGEANCWGRK